MPDEKAKHRRIYCICGQRMKIMEDMLGRPGKCVACRQKIRIPTAEEWPDEEERVHLKDHPEFLRVVKRSDPPEEGVEYTPLPADDADEGEGDEKHRHGPQTPLDVLEPLRVLANLEHRLKRKLQAVRKAEGNAKAHGFDEDQLQALADEVRKAREELDDELRQSLMEVAIDLTTVQKQVADALLKARVGETPLQDYLSGVEKQRRRRDTLERRQWNLRAWLAVRTPVEAGGRIRLPLDSPPPRDVRLTFEHEPDEAVPLGDWWVQELRQTLTLREQEERKLVEIDRSASEDPGLDMSRRREEAQADRDRAEATVVFCRERLEQLKRDFAGDLGAANAQLDLLRGRLKMGEIGRREFASREYALGQAQSDLERAVSLVKRALSANSAQDVPRSRATYLDRLADVKKGPGFDGGRVLAWLSAVPLLAALFLPAIGDMSVVRAFLEFREQTPGLHWLLILPAAGIVVVATAGMLRSPTPRGGLLAIVWAALCVGLCAFFHECGYALGPLGEEVRGAGVWAVQPGPLAFEFGLALLAGACALSLGRRLVGAIAGVVVFLAVALVLGAVVTDAGGLFRPNPVLSDTKHDAAEQVPGQFDSALTITNRGLRALVLSPHSTARNALDYAVERRIGENSWDGAFEPYSTELAGAPVPQTGNPELVVRPGGSAVLHYLLEPGDYRVRLGSHVVDRFSLAATTVPVPVPAPVEPDPERARVEPAPSEVEPPVPAPFPPAPTENLASSTPPAPTENLAASTAPAPTENLAASTQPDPPTPETEGAEPVEGPPRPAWPEAQLRGIMATEGKNRAFAMALHMPDGTTKNETLGIGDALYGDWILAEYNQEERALTLRNGPRLVIIRNGGRYPLKSREEASEPAP